MSTKEKRLIKADRDAIKDQMTTVIWTTLLGLPIVQPYRRGGRKQVCNSHFSFFLFVSIFAFLLDEVFNLHS
jgi:DNA-directed RNA polymerase